MNLADRIKHIRDTFNLTQPQLSELAECTSEGVIKGIEQGKTATIKTKYSIPISNKLGINREWIERGIGMMRNSHEEIINTMEIVESALNPNIISIKYYEDIRASAGIGCINDECIPAYIQLIPTILPLSSKSNNIEAIKVYGDSMTGTIQDNDIIFIDKNKSQVLNGKIYVVYMCDEVYVKRIFKDPKTKSLILKSDNPIYPQFEVTCEDFKIIGQVIANMNIKEL
ncbi:MAG: LexA family transcriptional regulator [Campylobacterota bacterium]|nr:LexA family transcriptional regulator [Campylobacterota bacterium]